MANSNLDQCRALAAVEHFTDIDDSYYAHIHDLKSIHGGAFDLARFCTGKVIFYGRIDFHVIESSAGLIFGHAHETKGEAIAQARGLILTIGADLLGELLADRRASFADKQAQCAIDQAMAASKIEQQTKPRKVGKRARAVFYGSEGKCHYCGVALTLDGRWHIEHKMPRALFGGSEQDNLAAACAPCNHAKRDKTDLEFEAILAARQVTN